LRGNISNRGDFKPTTAHTEAFEKGVSNVGKKKGYYTPQHGKRPEKIHRALAAINKHNGNKGATPEEIAKKSGVALTDVRREMSWGRKGNAGNMVIRKIKGGYVHTKSYDP
jgi:hypothetical protein